MPGTDLRPHLKGTTSDVFAQWLASRDGGNFQSYRQSAADVWKHAGDSEALQDHFGTGEVLDDLLDFADVMAGKKSSNPNPKKPGKNGKYAKSLWLSGKPKPPKEAPIELLQPFNF